MSARFRGEWYPIANHRLELSHLYECDEIEIEDDLVLWNGMLFTDYCTLVRNVVNVVSYSSVRSLIKLGGRLVFGNYCYEIDNDKSIKRTVL